MPQARRLPGASSADRQSISSLAPIRTTHVGSLPRPADVAALLHAKEHGEDYDADAFAAQDFGGERTQTAHGACLGDLEGEACVEQSS